MKFIFALFFIGFVAAQTPAPAAENPGRVLLELLEKRSDALLVSAKKTLADFKATAGENIVKALDAQVKRVETLDADLKKLVADTLTPRTLHQVHVYEEELFFLENRVSEEIYAISHATSTPTQNQTGPALIARAEKLIKDGKDAVAKFPQAKEVGEINSELIVVEALVKALQTTQPGNLKNEEQELVRQETTLQQLIEKATARKP